MSIILEERKSKLLIAIIEQYLKTVDPVGSNYIANLKKFSLSSATIRNEMISLEEEGFIYQPYTSAGRIPTDKGYQYYVNHFLIYQQPLKQEIKFLHRVVKMKKGHQMKNLAKGLVEISGLTVFVGFSKSDIYYTGLFQLFSQPEFMASKNLSTITEAIDHIDEILIQYFDQTNENILIKIGHDNPFGISCSSLLTRYENRKYGDGLIGMVGPKRMNYKKNYSLMKFTKDLINEL